MSAEWTDTHNADLYRAICEVVLAHRSSFYQRPALLDVNGHGGDKINARVKTILKKLVAGNPAAAAANVYEEAQQQLKKGDGTRGTPRKQKSTPRKRRADEMKEESEE